MMIYSHVRKMKCRQAKKVEKRIMEGHNYRVTTLARFCRAFGLWREIRPRKSIEKGWPEHE